MAKRDANVSKEGRPLDDALVAVNRVVRPETSLTFFSPAHLMNTAFRRSSPSRFIYCSLVGLNHRIWVGIMKVSSTVFVFFCALCSAGSSFAGLTEMHAYQPPSENIRRIVETKDYPPFVKECFGKAVEKLKKRAEAKEALLKRETIAVDEVDNRWWKPSKYVWFSATIETPEKQEKITVLMQKPLSGECF